MRTKDWIPLGVSVWLFCGCPPLNQNQQIVDAAPSATRDADHVDGGPGHLRDAGPWHDAGQWRDAGELTDVVSGHDAGTSPPPPPPSATDGGLLPDAMTISEDAGIQVSCDAPGVPSTLTPNASSEDDYNVQLLSCTRTTVALSCDVGTSHLYQENVANGVRTIQANAIVDHDVGTFPNPDNPNTISTQSLSYTMPVTPSGTGGPVQVPGILFSGAVLDPGTAEVWNGNDTWRYEALLYGSAPDYFSGDATFHPNRLGLDCNFAHVQPNGSYHYHGVPTSLISGEPALKQVGWAADGAPIFAAYGLSDATDPTSELRKMRSSYRLKSGARPAGGPPGDYDGTFSGDWEYVVASGDLDECNGRTAFVLVDGEWTERYHYVLTYTYPFIPRCTHFAADASFHRGAMMNGGPPGMGGSPPPCMPGQTGMCCGDGRCDGPETESNCVADCG